MVSAPQIVLTVLLSLDSSDGATESAPGREPICDDGSSPYDENDQPNLECEIEACAVGEPLCWSERLDLCYDASGDDNGTCHLLDKACASSLGCWGLYIACVGEWSCEDTHWWGCGRGTCLEPKK